MLERPRNAGFDMSGDVPVPTILSSRPEQITARAAVCGVEGPVVVTATLGSLRPCHHQIPRFVPWAERARPEQSPTDLYLYQHFVKSHKFLLPPENP